MIADIMKLQGSRLSLPRTVPCIAVAPHYPVGTGASLKDAAAHLKEQTARRMTLSQAHDEPPGMPQVPAPRLR
jgi:hypothetical protein